MINFLQAKKYTPHLSMWAYQYCRDISDEDNMCQYITDSWLAYIYCVSIKDRQEVRKYITESWVLNRYEAWKRTGVIRKVNLPTYYGYD